MNSDVHGQHAEPRGELLVVHRFDGLSPEPDAGAESHGNHAGGGELRSAADWGEAERSVSGAGGENIDMQSGDLNYTIPLLKAVGRGQTSVGHGAAVHVGL
jgi:hypothetical protein